MSKQSDNYSSWFKPWWKGLLLIAFFPFTLTYFIWKQDWKVPAKVLAVIVLWIFVISAGSSDKEKTGITPVAQVEQSVEVTPTPEASPQAELTLDQKIKALDKDIVTVMVDEALDVEKNVVIKGKKDILINVEMSGGYFNTKSMKSINLLTMSKIFSKTFPLDDSINRVIIVTKVPATDTYGKDIKALMHQVMLTRATYEKIQWDNFDKDNLETVADEFIENPNLK